MIKNKNYFDIIIIGSGIAGLSIASELSKECSVCILEKEKIPSYHSTGRSFAFYIESYGNKIIRQLTTASKDFFLEHSEKTNVNKLLKKRGIIYIGNTNQKKNIKKMYKEIVNKNNNIELFDKKETLKKISCLNEKYIESSIYDPDASDIDVNSMYNIYLKNFKTNNGKLFTDIKITKILKNKNWFIHTDKEIFATDLIVNAAGAWSDSVGSLVNAQKINLIPKQRTIFCFESKNIKLNNNWPLTVDVDENFYFKVENNIILGSPADETPTIPHDCIAEELDIAIGIERIKQATKFEFSSIINKWAGLRNFVKDKTPVIGFDQKIENFFWLSAQGGYGIQTAPSLAKIASNIIFKKNNDLYKNIHKINLDLLNVKRLL